MEKDKLTVSIVIPCLDEEGSLPELYNSICQVFESLDQDFEIIFVNDGSTDKTLQVMLELCDKDSRLKALDFRKNFGKAAALTAGFEEAKGEIVFTMDGDLQDDPKEIPRFLELINQGYDLVSGWKKKRYDPLSKTLPSKLFNKVTSLVTGISLHDFNCGFKAYRKEVLENITLYGELHRYIPALAGWKGFKVGELEVEHHPRKFGKSKYGVKRFAKGFFDLLTILLITKYSKRPLHLFGMAGLISSLSGFACLVYLSVLWFMGERPIGNRPLLTFGVLMVIFGMQIISVGLISEMLTKMGHKPTDEYSIRKKYPEEDK